MSFYNYKIFDVNDLDINKANNVALGNSIFELICVTDKHQIKLADTIKAVINEMPTISISSEWKDSPMTSIGQKLSNFLQNPVIDTVAQQSSNYQKLTLTDEYSKKFYNGISDISFDISFRLYQDSFFKTTNPIIAFNDIIQSLLPKKTFNFADAYSNITAALEVSEAAGTKVIDTVSNAYTNLSSITDANGGSITPSVLDNLANDINNALSSIAKNQALGNDYFLIKLGYNILGFAYPLEVVCTNCSFAFSKQTWYNETQKAYQPYYIDFNMAFVTLCTPSLNTWKKYINGVNDKSLDKIQSKEVSISQTSIDNKNLDSDVLNNLAISYLKSKTGLITATKDNVQTANDIYKKLETTITNTMITSVKNNLNYTPASILTMLQQGLKDQNIGSDLAKQLNLTAFKEYFTVNEKGDITILNQSAVEAIEHLSTSENIKSELTSNVNLTNAYLGKKTYGNSVSEITKSNDLSKQIFINNGVIQTNRRFTKYSYSI